MFKKPLAEKVMAGEKTVTRRMPSDNPRSPWWREECAYRVGRDYAVQPGRGKPQIGRVRMLSVEKVRLGRLTVAEARKEGFDSPEGFEDVWRSMHGPLEPWIFVWRLEFEVAEVRRA